MHESKLNANKIKKCFFLQFYVTRAFVVGMADVDNTLERDKTYSRDTMWSKLMKSHAIQARTLLLSCALLMFFVFLALPLIRFAWMFVVVRFFLFRWLCLSIRYCCCFTVDSSKSPYRFGAKWLSAEPSGFHINCSNV